MSTRAEAINRLNAAIEALDPQCLNAAQLDATVCFLEALAPGSPGRGLGPVSAVRHLSTKGF